MGDNASFSLSSATDLLALGGPVMLVLAAMSVIGLAIIMLKLWQFGVSGIWRRGGVDQALAAWQSGRGAEAEELLGGENHPIAETVRTAIAGLRTGVAETRVREEAARVGAGRLAALRSYFRPLEVIGSLSPLLGLLGTVLGMIEAFQSMESAGSQVDAALLSGGIWEALLTTAAGLSVAIPAVAALNWLERGVETLHEDMQDALTRVFTGNVMARPATIGDNAEASPAHAY